MPDLVGNPGDFLATYGLIAIFTVMLLKEAGLPVPVPSDLIMITAGVQAATGAFSLWQLGVALLVAIFVGGTIQYFLARNLGRQAIYRVGRLVGLTAARLDGAIGRLQRRGPVAIFVGLNLPGARAGIVVAAGLARLAYAVFAPWMVAGSAVFYGWHIALGYLVGPSATTLLESVHLPIVPVIAALAVVGLGGWLVLRRRRSDIAESSTLDSLYSWSEAACPACLAVAAVERLRAPTTSR
ncbi:MAG: associated Golgi protein [Chloroflexi bacterium]|nr:associated Golgi protein [Chloroflexota bacterium]